MTFRLKKKHCLNVFTDDHSTVHPQLSQLWSRTCHLKLGTYYLKDTYRMAGKYLNTLTFKNFLKLDSNGVVCFCFLYLTRKVYDTKIPDIFSSNLERRRIRTPSLVFVFWILSGLTVRITFSTTPTAYAMTECFGVSAGRTLSTQSAHFSRRLGSSCANAHSASLRTRSSIFNVATGSKTPHAHAYCEAVCRSEKTCLT